MRGYKSLIYILPLLLLLVGCAEKPSDFSRIEAMPIKKNLGINDIRLSALKDTARGLGAQAGLAWRSKQINDLLRAEDDRLNKIFDFNAMLLDDNVLPPVLEEGRSILNLDNNVTIRLADRDYEIIYPPRFVTAAPTWRDYLWVNFHKPEIPDVSLMPKNETERKVWNEYINIGWNEGVKQSNEIFNTNLARLKRDYSGMILYKKLYAYHMVSAPFVSKADLGITGDADTMRVNDRVLRITSIPEFNPNSKTWQPVFTGDDVNPDTSKPKKREIYEK